MLKYFLISIVILPALLGVAANMRRGRPASRTALWLAWAFYVVLWFMTLYALRRRWT